MLFTDENLEAAVRGPLEKPEWPLTKGAIRELTGLDAHSEGVEYLLGLEYAVNLTSLRLNGNQITDISPLASLTNLIELHLYDNPLNQESIDVHVPNLRDRGVDVTWFGPPGPPEK